MGAEERGDVAAMLSEVGAGSPADKDRLIRAIYGDLVRIARGLMRRERRDHTLQPSALVHEAVVRLLKGEASMESSDTSHVLIAAVQAMRQVLVDHARRRKAGKRGGGRARVPLDEVLASFEEQGLDMIDLHQALEHLAQSNPQQAQVVELHIFGGLSIGEVAKTLGVSRTTVETRWRFARAWLRDQLGGSRQ
jgi:RNA polymerase sigma factor (TIGR02999 family)